MLGPGKYDDLCTTVREQAQAEGVLLIVFNGGSGSGFACQAPLPVQLILPQLLRDIADQIEQDLAQGKL